MTLQVNTNTAYTWISKQDKEDRRPRGGSNKKLTEVQIQRLIEHLERDPQLTLKQLYDKVWQDFQISQSSVHNYLHGQLITVKKVHHVVETMNNDANKEKRRAFVERISLLMQNQRYIIWIDETNFNLYCRRTQGRSSVAQRVPVALPGSKGPNVHIIGAISAYQISLFFK